VSSEGGTVTVTLFGPSKLYDILLFILKQLIFRRHG
jgi:hypothetical protein